MNTKQNQYRRLPTSNLPGACAEGWGESAYWETLISLEKQIHTFLREDYNKENLERILDDPALSAWVRSQFGVVGGSFGYAHNSLETFMLLENAAYRPRSLPDKVPVIDINYHFQLDNLDEELRDQSTRSKVGRMIDLIFMGTRSEQRPRQEPPEFYYKLPAQAGGMQDQRQLPLRPAEQALMDRGFKGLYVTSGEILFFSYVWRSLLRRQDDAPDKASDRDDVLPPVEFEAGFYDDSPERQWMKVLADKETERKKLERQANNPDDQRRLDFLTDALAAWEQGWRKGLDDSSPDALHDWHALGLLRGATPSVRPTTALIAFLEYAVFVIDQILQQEHGAPGAMHAGDLKQLQEAQQRLSMFRTKAQQKLAQDAPIEAAILNEGWDACLQQIGESMLTYLPYVRPRNGHAGTLEKRTLIGRLHQLARFPILPYFYMIAFDKTPRQHVVFPVHESGSHQIIVGQEKHESFAVVVCLLTLTPFWALGTQRERVSEPPPYEECGSEDTRRLMRLNVFFKRLASPIIELGYLGSTVDPSTHAQGLEDQIVAFSHEVSKLTGAIQTKTMVMLSDLFLINGKGDIPTPIGNLALNDSLTGAITQWQVCANTNFLENLYRLLFIWAGSRDVDTIISLPDEADFSEVLHRCVDIARQMNCTSALIHAENPDGYDSILMQQTMYQELLEEAPVITVTRKEGTQELRWREGADNQHKSAFFRGILAAFMNAIQHTQEDTTIDCIWTVVDDELSIVIENTPKKMRKRISSKIGGTESVLRHCAKTLDGRAYFINKVKEKNRWSTFFGFPWNKLLTK